MAEADKWKQTALLVIDMQKDFILGDSVMTVKGGKAIVPNVILSVEIARQRGILVVWVVREHDPQGRDVELFRRHFYSAGKVGPTSKGSAGAELVDGLVIKEGDYKLVKTRFSAFFATHLHQFLQTEGIKYLVIVGVQTPNCIRQTVFDAVALDYLSVSVIVDATAAATPDVHLVKERKENLQVMTREDIKAHRKFSEYFHMVLILLLILQLSICLHVLALSLVSFMESVVRIKVDELLISTLICFWNFCWE